VLEVFKRSGLLKYLGPHYFYKDNERALKNALDALGAAHNHHCHLTKD
jgi:hypothetical protein